MNQYLPILLPVFMLFMLNPLLSQEEEDNKKVRFNGLGRTNILHTEIDGNIKDTDTSTVNQLSDGEFLLDLAINATPNKVTEIQTILRLRNEFGGFFGAGISVEVRELWARGIIGKKLKYRVGDMDVEMTPYTLFIPLEEGTVNEPEIFQPQKEVIYYEQFYINPHSRRLQGGKLDFGLRSSKIIKDIDMMGFAARIAGTDFFTIPSRFIGGAQLDLVSYKIDSIGFQVDAGANLVHTWDDLQSGEATEGMRNTVLTFDFDVTGYENESFGVHLLGEVGQSMVEFMADSTIVRPGGEDEEIKVARLDEDDYFIEIGAMAELKKLGLELSAMYMDVGPDFFSTGAQSRRIDLTREKTFYNRIGNDRMVRMPNLFDISRDRALYSFQLSDQLMPFDLRYSNTLPYGNATPNRRGLHLAADYKEKMNIVNARVDAYFLEEIRGQGTPELKSFTLLRGAVDFNINQLTGWRNKLQLTLGAQIESTQRDGLEIEQVDLNSNLIELGLQAELFSNFDLLIGAKLFTSEGSDYVPTIEGFNDIQDFPARVVVDDTEQLLAAGLRYRFTEDIYLTAQYQQFSFERATDAVNAYDLRQIFVLYNMNF